MTKTRQQILRLRADVEALLTALNPVMRALVRPIVARLFVVLLELEERKQ